jgi:hypothetical protein
VLTFARTRRHGASWILLDRRRTPFSLALDHAYAEVRYTLHHVS